MSRNKSIIPGLTFSWKRALGITGARQRLTRQTGIPTTRQGMERKVGSALVGVLFSIFSGGKKR
ncbi:MAG: hypothetical protein LBC48_05330 [Dysgonamonadaceae bacterium]|jgi:hypothetical protein|nr:hypothetical protein [Dysgonamonadaceae bacterium]